MFIILVKYFTLYHYFISFWSCLSNTTCSYWYKWLSYRCCYLTAADWFFTSVWPIENTITYHRCFTLWWTTTYTIFYSSYSTETNNPWSNCWNWRLSTNRFIIFMKMFFNYLKRYLDFEMITLYTLITKGLSNNTLPGLVERMVEGVYVMTGMPWYATIITSTLLIRLLFVYPALVIYKWIYH